MIKSMTGYGSAKGLVADLSVTVELKSVNNKFLETSVRMPRSFLFAEEAVKAAVGKHTSRGKVDVFVTIDSSASDDMTVKVNEALLKSYLTALRQISAEYGLADDISVMSVSRIPDILSVEKKDIDPEAISEGLLRVTEAALQDYDVMRQREGAKLKEDIESRLVTIEGFVSTVETSAPVTVTEYRKRLEKKMMEVLGASGIDENRILTEAALFADHIAVDEETVRLRSHISQMRTMIDGGSPIGRKLDFLIQEFNREANTIASKCQNSDIAHVAVDLKSEIEKIREQIQNIE